MSQLNENTSKIQNLIEKISNLPKDRYEEGYNEGYEKGYNESYDIGVIAERERFWNDYTTVFDKQGVPQERTDYDYAFAYWQYRAFKPTKSFTIGRGYRTFYYFNNGGEPFDLKGYLEQNGLTLDTSKATYLTNFFNQANISHIPTIDLRALTTTSLDACFQSSGIETIEKIILDSNKDYTFSMWTFASHKLKEIRFEGNINNNITFKDTALLSKDSIVNIMGALSTTTTGTTISLPKSAVNKAFETSEGANDGSNSTEWKALADTKKNWTITLA